MGAASLLQISERITKDDRNRRNKWDSRFIESRGPLADGVAGAHRRTQQGERRQLYVSNCDRARCMKIHIRRRGEEAAFRIIRQRILERNDRSSCAVMIQISETTCNQNEQFGVDLRGS